LLVSVNCDFQARQALRLGLLGMLCGLPGALGANSTPPAMRDTPGHLRQLTQGPGGRILTNHGVWSPDSQWIVFDTRPDAAGEQFLGSTIQVVHTHTSEIRELYQSSNGAHCGVATWHPSRSEVVFILGPEHPTPDWSYGPTHRQGVFVAMDRPGRAIPMDARDLVPPHTPGALRGGSHVHVVSPLDGWVSFTYEDHLLAPNSAEVDGREMNLRAVGVSIPGHPVQVPATHPRNHSGSHFTFLATRLAANPTPGSDQIKKAFEEGWVGSDGYLRPDGTRQRHALAFQGHVVSAKGETVPEVFIVDLPEDPTQPGDGPLAGTATTRPLPPRGASQRRLTFTADREHPGLRGPRHWLRCSPDGSQIGFFMADPQGVPQFWTVSPNGGAPRQVTRNPSPAASAFTWSPNGRFVTFVVDGSVTATEVATGVTHRLTPRVEGLSAPRPEACVFSPDGRSIAHVRRVAEGGVESNQIFIATLPKELD